MFSTASQAGCATRGRPPCPRQRPAALRMSEVTGSTCGSERTASTTATTHTRRNADWQLRARADGVSASRCRTVEPGRKPGRHPSAVAASSVAVGTRPTLADKCSGRLPRSRLHDGGSDTWSGSLSPQQAWPGGKRVTVRCWRSYCTADLGLTTTPRSSARRCLRAVTGTSA